MALVTAGVIAGTTALTVGTAAAVAVEVGLAVALVGTTLKVVGTIVRDPGLAEAGGQMTMAGGALSLGGMAGGYAAGGAAAGFTPFHAAEAAPVGEVGTQAVDQTLSNGAQVVGDQTVAGSLAAAPQPDAITGGVGQDTLMGATTTTDTLAATATPTGTAGGASLDDPGADSGAMPAPTSPSPPAAEVAPAQPAAKAAPTMTGPATGQPVTAEGVLQERAGSDIVARSLAEYQKNNPTGGLGDWFARQPDWIKATVAMQGLNAVGGGLGGILTGKNMGERLDFDKQVAQWRQNQVEYQNKNNAYAPRVVFPRPGLMNR